MIKSLQKLVPPVLTTSRRWRICWLTHHRLIRRNFHSQNDSAAEKVVFQPSTWWPILATTATGLIVLGGGKIVMDNTAVCGCEEKSVQEEEQRSNNNDEPSNHRLQTCGDWCAGVSDETTPCLMDESKVPCRGDYCVTTAGLWNLFVLPRRNRPVSCDMYKDGRAYPRGAKPCDPACLIPEVLSERYPAPTGLGVFCRPGTCSPGATPNPANSDFGSLQCPCNWFGSECRNDWVFVERIDRKWEGGESSSSSSLLRVTLHVPKEQWKAILREWRPGSIVRIHYAPPSSTDSLYEMSCAVACFDTTGQVEILVAAPHPSLRPEVRKVAELLRSSSSSAIKGLHVNPAISGFYNGRYEYLSTIVSSDEIEDLVFVSSGAGLAGVLPVVEAMIRKLNREKVKIHLYHQVRQFDRLPYKGRIEQLLSQSKDDTVTLTLVETSPPIGDPTTTTRQQQQYPALSAALRRGERLRREATAGLRAFTENDIVDKHQKAYVQDVFGNESFRLATTAVVVCGHLRVMDDTRNLLIAKARQQEGTSKDWIDERFFVNI